MQACLGRQAPVLSGAQQCLSASSSGRPAARLVLPHATSYYQGVGGRRVANVRTGATSQPQLVQDGDCSTAESPDQCMERMLQESFEVETRVVNVDTEEALLQRLEDAGDKLVLLEVQSETVCDTGMDEPEPELHWKLDAERAHKERMAKCSAVKDRFQRTARSCPDVTFLALTVDGSPETETLQKRLNVSVLPTLQFYKRSKLLYEHKGVLHMEEGMGEGVMFYDGTSPAVKPIVEVADRPALDAFLKANSDDKVLTVLNVSTTSAKPCIKVFPAVVALAHSFRGYASFGRLVGDASVAGQRLMAELRVQEVPTFIFYRGGKEVGRHIGSSRGDLIGQILQQQSNHGISPPPPPVTTSPKVKKTVKRR